jgi:hypothetical protein
VSKSHSILSFRYLTPIIASPAQVGGWIGLFVGASVISFVEIAYFGCDLIMTFIVKSKEGKKPGSRS